VDRIASARAADVIAHTQIGYTFADLDNRAGTAVTQCVELIETAAYRSHS
jgi:hypothetical protein